MEVVAATIVVLAVGLVIVFRRAGLSLRATPRKTRQLRINWQLALSAVVILSVCGSMLFLSIRHVEKTISTQSSWPTTDGTVLSSRLDRTRIGGDAGYDWSLRVHFEYPVEGRSYSGHQTWKVEISGNRSSSKSSQEERDQFQVGESYPISYDPADPSRAVIDPTQFSIRYLWIIEIVFWIGLAGAIMLTVAIVQFMISLAPRDDAPPDSVEETVNPVDTPMNT